MITYDPKALINSLSFEELRKRALEQDERCRLMVKSDDISLFKYDVRTDVMYFWTKGEDGEVVYSMAPDYSMECPAMFFHDSQRYTIPTVIRSIASGKEEDHGYRIFRHRDGHKLSCQYASVYDEEEGGIITIVGQLVDLYATPSKMRETIERLNEKVSHIESLQKAYETIISITIEDFSFQLLKATQEVRDAATKAADVLVLAQLFCKNQVKEKYQAIFQEFMDPHTLAKRLEGQRFLSVDYQTHNLGWVHARLIPTESDKMGLPAKVILTTECTNDHNEEVNYLKIASEKDYLTGLYNRFKGEKEIKALLEQKRPMIFALLDCDHFKTINDYYGHPVGDVVLTEIARVMREVYPTEVVIRLGGDEFVICIAQPDSLKECQQNPRMALTRLRTTIAQLEIPQLQGRHISLSCGATLYDGKGEAPTFDELYQRADKALYESKKKRQGYITIV